MSRIAILTGATGGLGQAFAAELPRKTSMKFWMNGIKDYV